MIPTLNGSSDPRDTLTYGRYVTNRVKLPDPAIVLAMCVTSTDGETTFVLFDDDADAVAKALNQTSSDDWQRIVVSNDNAFGSLVARLIDAGYTVAVIGDDE